MKFTQIQKSAVKLFAAKVEREDRFFSPVLGPGEVVTPTDVVVTVSEILRAVYQRSESPNEASRVDLLNSVR